MPGFTFHFFHYGQRTGARADHQPAALPGDLFLRGQRRVAESVAVFFGRLLLAFAYLSAVDHYVVLVGHAIDADRTKGERFDLHQPLLWIKIVAFTWRLS